MAQDKNDEKLYHYVAWGVFKEYIKDTREI